MTKKLTQYTEKVLQIPLQSLSIGNSAKNLDEQSERGSRRRSN